VKFLVEIELPDFSAKTDSEWALWVLQCICAHLRPGDRVSANCQHVLDTPQ
jgi:hypothetical protein